MKKICKGCGELKEYYCKGMCSKCYDEKYRLENSEKIKAVKRKWYSENLEKAKTVMRKWKKENSEKVNVCSRKYRLENKEKINAYAKKWRLENSEKLKAIFKKYRLENPEKVKAAHRKWRKENPGKRKEYYQKNPGKFREWNLKRRTNGKVEKGIADRIINENILKYGILTCENTKGKKEDGHCEHCENDFHIDHIVPVSRGGSNNYDNLQILCQHCNCKKHVGIADYRQTNKNKQMFLKTSGG